MKVFKRDFQQEGGKIFSIRSRNYRENYVVSVALNFRILREFPPHLFSSSSLGIADKKINRSLQKVGTYSKGLSGSRSWFFSLSLSIEFNG